MSATTPQRSNPTPTPPPLPQGVMQVALKSVAISGTNLYWEIFSTHEYSAIEKGEGGKNTIVKHAAEIQGIGLATPPPQVQAQEGGTFVRIEIIYPEYRDLFIVADHLIIKNAQFSEILVAAKPGLVVPG